MSDQNNNPNQPEDFDAFLKEFAPKSDAVTSDVAPSSTPKASTDDTNQPAYGLGDDFNPQATQTGFAGFDLNSIAPVTPTTDTALSAGEPNTHDPQLHATAQPTHPSGTDPLTNIEQELSGLNIPSAPNKPEPNAALDTGLDNNLFDEKPTTAEALAAAGVAGAAKTKSKFSWASLFGKKDKTPKSPKPAKTKPTKPIKGKGTTKPIAKATDTPNTTDTTLSTTATTAKGKKPAKDAKASKGFSLFGAKKTPKDTVKPTPNKPTPAESLTSAGTTTETTTPLSADDPIASILAKDGKNGKAKKSVRPAKSSTKGGTHDNAKKRTMMLIGLLIALALIAVAAFMALNREPEPAPPPPPPAVTPEPPPVIEEPPMPDPAVEGVLPDTAPLINPDEILNGEIPDNPALLKEEIDRLSDTNTRLNEQSQSIEQQLGDLEELNKLKAEQIALYEAQIAELEKLGGAAPADSAPAPEAPKPAQ